MTDRLSGVISEYVNKKGRKYLVYKEGGVNYYQCIAPPIASVNCEKALMTYEVGGCFCKDVNLTKMIEGVNKETSDKIQKLSGKKLENYMIDQMKEHKIYCVSGDNK